MKSQPTSIRLKTEVRSHLMKAANQRRWGLSKLIEIILEQWIDWDRKQAKKK